VSRTTSWGAALALATASSLVAPHDAAAEPGTHPRVALLGDHVARAAPRTHASRVAAVAGRRPLTHVRTVLPELARSIAPGGRAWIHVALPGRPNGSTGWIRAGRTRATATPWRITVDLSERRVLVSRSGRVARRFRAVVGAPSTPTPHGRFFIEEALALGDGSAGGPFALATSARSDVYQEFAGGPGQIALHGRNHLRDPLGTASSHGCIRLGTRAITWLTERIDAGVPLIIKR
jgi:lipoprotein-anchoring transpeptidase ErfK/SrfK